MSIKKRSFLFSLILIIIPMLLVVSCAGDGDGGVNEQLLQAECNKIRNDCDAIASAANNQCIDAEPETQDCEIEMEGLYNEAFYDCAMEAGGSDCEEPKLSEYKCLADCYYANVDAASFKIAQDECMYECVYSLLY